MLTPELTRVQTYGEALKASFGWSELVSGDDDSHHSRALPRLRPLLGHGSGGGRLSAFFESEAEELVRGP